MKLLIGLVGHIGSGKGKFIEFLQDAAGEAKVERIASSQLLKETLDLWDIQPTRKALQNLAIIMNANYGDNTLSHAMLRRINQSGADIVVYDGMRWKSDEKMVRNFPDSLIVYVTAEPRIRFGRICVRREKADEAELTFERFEQEAKAKTELEIADIGNRADAIIKNNGTLEEYKDGIEKVFRQVIEPRLR